MKYKSEIRDTVWLLALQGLNYLAPLFVWPYLMVVLGAEKFGLIGFSTSIAQVGMLLVDFGFNLSAAKQIAQAESEQEINKLFSATMAAKFILLTVAAMLLAVAEVIPRFEPYRLTTLIMFLMVVGNTFTFVWLFQGLGKIRIVSIVNTICKLSILPLCFVFVKSEKDVYVAALIQASVYVMSGMVMIILRRIWKMGNWQKIGWQDILDALKNAWPVFVSTAVGSIYTLLFTVILSWFSSPDEVGRYAATEKIVRVISYCMMIPVVQAFYPKISKMSKDGHQTAKKLSTQIALGIGVVAIPVFFALFFFSEELMHFLGKDYAGTDMVFKIMAPLPLLIGLSGVLGQLGLLANGGEKEKKIFSYIYIVAAIVALVSIFSFSATLNATYTALALLITELCVTTMMCYAYRKL